MYAEEVHRSDTMQEKLSLAARFGVNISFDKPSKKLFDQIVTELAKGADIDMPEDELINQANVWSLRNGGYSGRTAEQFIVNLLSKN